MILVEENAPIQPPSLPLVLTTEPPEELGAPNTLAFCLYLSQLRCSDRTTFSTVASDLNVFQGIKLITLLAPFVYSSTSQTLDPARQIFGRCKTGDYDLQRSRSIILSLLVAENDRSRP